MVKQHAILDELIAHGVPARFLEPKRDFDQDEREPPASRRLQDVTGASDTRPRWVRSA